MFNGITIGEFRQLMYKHSERNGIRHNSSKETELAGKDSVYLFLRRNQKVRHRKLVVIENQNDTDTELLEDQVTNEKGVFTIEAIPQVNSEIHTI